MNVTRSVVACLAAAFSVAFATPSPAADAPKPADAVQRVVKLISTSADAPRDFGRTRGGGGGRPGGGRTPAPTPTTPTPTTGYLIVTPADGGPPVKVTVSDDLRRKLPSLADQRGELISVTVKSGSLGDDVVTAAVPFDGPKALRNPRAYVFEGLGEQKLGVQTFATAKLSKFGQTREAYVPNRPTLLGGRPVPDAAILDRLKALTAGDVIDVELAPGPARDTFSVVDVDTARDPKFAEFVKTTTAKNGDGKPTPAVVLLVDGQERTYALPAPTAAPGSAPSPSAAAVAALARRLQPGHTVRFVTRDAPAAQTPPLRDLRLDGELQPQGERSLHLVSTYVRIEFSPARFSAAGGDVNVSFHPTSSRPDDRLLEDGVERAIESDAEITRLKLSEGQAKQLSATLDTRLPRQDTQPTQQERAQWAAAYQAWTTARDPAARARVEQDMVWAAHDVAARWRKDVQAKHALLRSILTPEQLEEVNKLGAQRRQTN